MSQNKKYLIVITGPTAVGKTDIAIKLALHFNTVILSADARQFYREMEIGTAKPDALQLQQVKHYFIDSLSIHDNYDAGKYADDVLTLTDILFNEHDVVILCGGSGLFIHAVLYGLDDFPEADAEIRKMLIAKWHSEGIASLQKMLQQHDPEYYQEVDIQNPHRIIRALEVCLQTGNTFSAYRKNQHTPRSFEAIKICLTMDRQQLYTRINERVDKMILDGLMREAEELYENKDVTALNTVGYKELFDCIEGKYTLEQAIEKIKQNTRNYAKRQLTWFRRDSTFTWLETDDPENITAYIEKQIK